jgi:hypothetical protein
MPQIPEAQKTPTVSRELVPGPKAQRVDVSSGMISLAQAAGDVIDVGFELKQKYDKTKAQNALLEFDNIKNNILFNPENGYYNSNGQAAVEGMKSTEEAIQDAYNRVLKNIKGGAAQSLFKEAAGVRMVRDKQDMLKHAAKGQLVWEAATLKSEEDNALNNAVLYYDNEKELATYFNMGLIAVSEQQDILGEGKEAKARSLEEFRSAFTAAAINGALARGDLIGVEKVQNTYGKYLEGNDKVVIDAKIKDEKDKQYILHEANIIFSPAKTLTQMHEEIRKEPDLEKRKEIKREVDNMYESNKTAEEQQRQNQVDHYYLEIAEGRMIYAQVPFEVKQSIGAKGNEVLKTAQRSVATGKNVTNDHVLFNELINLSDKERANLNAYEYYDSLDTKHREQLKSAIDASRKKIKDPTITRVQTNSAIAMGSIEELLGKKFDKKKTRHREFAQAYNDLLANRVEAATAQKGAELTEVEFRKLNHQLTRDVTTGKANIFGMMTKMNLEDVPVEYWPEIEAALIRKNKPVTVKNIVNVYNQGKDKGYFK